MNRVRSGGQQWHISRKSQQMHGELWVTPGRGGQTSLKLESLAPAALPEASHCAGSAIKKMPLLTLDGAVSLRQEQAAACLCAAPRRACPRCVCVSV